MLLVGVVTIVGLVVSVQGGPAVCPRGYFGPNCVFSCHCRTSPTCAWNGQCPNNDNCEWGYFGPACQYVDLLQLYPTPLVPTSIYDGDDSTCFTRQTSSRIIVTLRVLSPLAWIRISSSNQNQLMNFTLKVNDNISCPDDRKYVFAEKIVDIHCGFTGNLRSLTVEGPLAFYICSINLSSGRNVAMFQNASASSVNKEHRDKSWPKFMVDGDTGGNLTEHGCANTDLQVNAWLAVEFSTPVVLYSIRIHSRTDTFLKHIWGFDLEITDGEETLYLGYEDNSILPRLQYYIPLPEPMVVTSIRIHTWRTQYITVCELEAFGDIPCHNNTYGIICQNQCECDDFQVCNEITGACGRACPTHLYGIDCHQNCPQHCQSGCTWHTGRCDKCMPGFLGDFCQAECPKGEYGPNCTFKCSARCQAACHHVTGACACSAGYTGVGCTDRVKTAVSGWLVAAILAGITIVCCCPFCLRLRRYRIAQQLPQDDQRPDNLEEQESEPHETEEDILQIAIKGASCSYHTIQESVGSLSEHTIVASIDISIDAEMSRRSVPVQRSTEV